MKRNFEMFEVDTWIEPNEEKIVDTVNKSIECLYCCRYGVKGTYQRSTY